MTQQWADEREARTKERQKPPKATDEPEEELLGSRSTASSDDEPLREEVRDRLREFQ